MGREVKRVHIDFDWYEKTLQKSDYNDSFHCDTWKGYLMDGIECPLCDGTGKNKSGKQCPECYGEEKTSPKIEPPKGYDFEKTNGYQIWQNVSEGSPVSPVFLKPEDLAKWMVENDTSITRGTTYEAWLKMIKKEGSAPSMVGNSAQGIKPGTSLYENKSDAEQKGDEQ